MADTFDGYADVLEALKPVDFSATAESGITAATVQYFLGAQYGATQLNVMKMLPIVALQMGPARTKNELVKSVSDAVERISTVRSALAACWPARVARTICISTLPSCPL
jgi:hypothetical protein